MNVPTLREDDCVSLIIAHLAPVQKNQGSQPRGLLPSYGYELYLPNLMRAWLEQNGVQFHEAHAYLPSISSIFYSAAWELCRRGILRPGIREYGEQSTADGASGNGYSVTPFGRQWLKEPNLNTFVPTEPGRFAEMIGPAADRFGPGFHDRANEAIRCYQAHAYLACCVMCGAAAESIMLRLAIAKSGNESEVLDKYRAANGRRALENMLIGQQKGATKQEFEVCFSLLKYWRDEAAHGRRSQISENEAFTSLALLLRCGQFALDQYDLLISNSE